MMPNPVVHFDIGCRDREKANEFYTTLFGWSTADYGPFSKTVDTGSDLGISGYLTALGHEPHNYVMVYVQVEDIPTHTKRVVELGGEVVMPETEVPTKGSFAWIKDLDENLVGLWKPAE